MNQVNGWYELANFPSCFKKCGKIYLKVYVLTKQSKKALMVVLKQMKVELYD